MCPIHVNYACAHWQFRLRCMKMSLDFFKLQNTLRYSTNYNSCTIHWILSILILSGSDGNVVLQKHPFSLLSLPNRSNQRIFQRTLHSTTTSQVKHSFAVTVAVAHTQPFYTFNLNLTIILQSHTVRTQCRPNIHYPKPHACS